MSPNFSLLWENAYSYIFLKRFLIKLHLLKQIDEENREVKPIIYVMNVDFKRLLGLKYSDKDHQYKKDVSLVESIQFLKNYLFISGFLCFYHF